MVQAENGITIPIDTLLNHDIDIPPKFLRCYKCRKPAIYIQCCNIAAPLAFVEYPDPEENEFANALRKETNTNFEAPVCIEHMQ